MKRDHIAKAAARELEAGGFATVLASNMHTFADVFAQGAGGKLIIKAVHNIDSVTRKEAVDLFRLSQFIGAEPLVVGEKSKESRLKRGVSYYRFSIRCISPEMLADITANPTPLLASKSVGLKVRIDGTRLRKLRKMSGAGISELARAVKISSSTLYKHEHETSYAAAVTVSKLERVLGESIKAEGSQLYKRVPLHSGRLEKTGLRALRLNSAPFDIVAKNRNYFEISLDANSRTMAKRAAFFSEIRERFENNYPFFISSMKKSKVLGVPVIGKKDMAAIESEDELLNLVY